MVGICPCSDILLQQADRRALGSCRAGRILRLGERRERPDGHILNALLSDIVADDGPKDTVL